MAIFWIFFAALSVTLIISAFNYFAGPYLESFSPMPEPSVPKVSVLIPVRDEEVRLASCLEGVLALEYGNKEIIVYDDQSSDATPEILSRYKDLYPDIKTISGKEKPEGWVGKNWACHNLYEASSGDILLFVDADVSLSGVSLKKALACFSENSVSLLSCFPRQIMLTPGEWLIVPAMNLILLTMLPLRSITGSKHPALAAANGQFMMFRRKDYIRSGGHGSVRNDPVEDIALCRLMKKNGFRVMTALGGEDVECRMYAGLAESISGFSKNFFKGAKMPPGAFLFFIVTFFTVFTAPFIIVFFRRDFLLLVILAAAARAFVSLSSRQNVFLNVVLHPLQMALMLIVGIKSMKDSVSGTLMWKGRRL